MTLSPVRRGSKYGTPLHYADELEPCDRSRLIEILKDIKTGQCEKSRANWSEKE